MRYVDSKGRTPLYFAVTAGYNNISDFINLMYTPTEY